MPITAEEGAQATKSCPDETCEGHELRTVGVTLRTVMWTSRVGENVATTAIAKREELVDASDEDRVCEHCGSENVVGKPDRWARLSGADVAAAIPLGARAG
jgi:hypothetical protein